MRKIASIVVTIVAFTLLLSGCGDETQATKVEQTIKFGVLPIEDNLPFYIAENKNKFKEAGLNVELVPFDSAAQRDTALQAGQIDGEVADLVAVALLKKGGTDVKAVSIGLGANPTEGRFCLLASPDSGIESAKDLKDKTIALSENTIMEFLVDQFVINNGLQIEAVKKEPIANIPVRLQALTNSKVDAAILPDPLATLAETQGAKIIIDDTEGQLNLSQTVIVFNESALKEKSEAVEKLLQIYSEAGQALTNNPEAYRQLLIEKARVPKPIQESYLAPSFSPLQLPAEEDVNRVMSWMEARGLLEKAYTYEEIVDGTMLK